MLSARGKRQAQKLGIDPSPALQALEKAILRQEPGLDFSPSSAPAGPVGAEDDELVGLLAALEFAHRVVNGDRAGGDFVGDLDLNAGLGRLRTRRPRPWRLP